MTLSIMRVSRGRAGHDEGAPETSVYKTQKSISAFLQETVWLSSPSPSSGKMVSTASPFSGLRSMACIVLAMGFLAGVMAFDNSRKDNVSISYYFTSIPRH